VICCPDEYEELSAVGGCQGQCEGDDPPMGVNCEYPLGVT